MTSDNVDDITGAPPRTTTLAIEAGLMASNRHIKYINFDDHGYSVLDVTPERAQMDYFVIEDKTDPDTGARHEASWQTLAGSGQVTPAPGRCSTEPAPPGVLDPAGLGGRDEGLRQRLGGARGRRW